METDYARRSDHRRSFIQWAHIGTRLQDYQILKLQNEVANRFELQVQMC